MKKANIEIDDQTHDKMYFVKFANWRILLDYVQGNLQKNAKTILMTNQSGSFCFEMGIDGFYSGMLLADLESEREEKKERRMSVRKRRNHRTVTHTLSIQLECHFYLFIINSSFPVFYHQCSFTNSCTKKHKSKCCSFGGDTLDNLWAY